MLDPSVIATKVDRLLHDPSRWLFRFPFCYIPARWILTDRAMELLNSINATIARMQIDPPKFTIGSPGTVSLIDFARKASPISRFRSVW
jgi:hypothetical protein